MPNRGEVPIVSTFYLLPAKAVLGAGFAGYLGQVFPGLDWSVLPARVLTDLLGAAAAYHPEVYLVHRDELPDGDDLAGALADGFGAEAGDEVVEVRLGPTPGELQARRWRLGDACC